MAAKGRGFVSEPGTVLEADTGAARTAAVKGLEPLS